MKSVENSLIAQAMHAAATQFAGMKDAHGIPVDPSTVMQFASAYLAWMRNEVAKVEARYAKEEG
jgi:hypothetical protein